jgi:hypothetical protein
MSFTRLANTIQPLDYGDRYSAEATKISYQIEQQDDPNFQLHLSNKGSY